MITVMEAAGLLRRGELVIIPTETVYGIAADATNPDAVAKLDAAKQRADGKHYSWLVAGLDDVAEPVDITPDVRELYDAFSPGPLTMVLNLRSGGTVGVRSPNHPKTLELLLKLGTPLACPSANISGQTPPTRFADAVKNFGGKIAALDGGDCEVGLESTVIDMTAAPPRILRRGALSKRDIKNVIGANPSGVTVLGITGGTGSGKTTALRALEKLGATVLDCDAVYHELLSDTEMLGEIGARFDGVVSDGALDRKALGAIVFNDASALRDLNAITHKYVDREIFKVIRELEAAGGSPVVALDAIALIESGLYKSCDHMTAVIAPKEKRIARIMTRDGIDYDYASSRVAAQKPDDFYENACDETLLNDGGEAEFFELCTAHFKKVINDLT